MLYCVGSNSHGEFGDGHTTTLKTLTRLKWCSNMNIKHVYNGDLFSIYRNSDDTFYAAGYNTEGQCIQKIKATSYNDKVRVFFLFLKLIFYFSSEIKP